MLCVPWYAKDGCYVVQVSLLVCNICWIWFPTFVLRWLAIPSPKLSELVEACCCRVGVLGLYVYVGVVKWEYRELVPGSLVFLH